MKNYKITTKEAAKEVAKIIKAGYEHYPSVHALENSILEVYSLKTGANLKNLKRSARAIRLTADIDWRAVFYCSLISTIVGENISPKLYNKVCDDLILINEKGDFVKVSDMKKIKVKGDEYAIISKGKDQSLLVIKMEDPYWYGSVHLYDYYRPKDIMRAIAHVPMDMAFAPEGHGFSL